MGHPKDESAADGAGAGEAAIQEAKTDKDATADDLEKAPEQLNMSDNEEMAAANDKDTSEGGKIKALLNVLRRMIGVKDLAAIRLSLPANLLEPVPNLEYWNYMDRADIFSVVGDLDDPLDRMLATLRFSLTKELKFVHGKVCKPYNSILGEHFRCHWDVQAPDVSQQNGVMTPRMALRVDSPSPLPLASNASSASSIKSSKQSKADRRAASSAAQSTTDDSSSVAHDKQASTASNANDGKKSGILGAGTAALSPSQSNESSKTRRGISRLLSATRTTKPSSSSAANSIVSNDSASTSGKSVSANAQKIEEGDEGNEGNEASGDAGDGADSPGGSFKTSNTTQESRRVCFLTEQVSHHPPISSFFVECKDAGVQLYGVDQLSAKFTGTNIKIYPGDRNKGIFLRLTDQARCGAQGEEYQITHPTASINGMLRGSLWVSIQNTTYITCRGGKRDNDSGKRLRAITEYKDESWVMKAKYALEGIIYEDEDASEGYSTIKEVPSERILLTYEGTWKGQISFKLKGEKESRLLIDLNEVDPLKNHAVRPLEAQDEYESRKIWKDVTEAIINKEFGAATKHKQTIEQKQREIAAERKRKGEEFKPRFFEEDIEDGRPHLTEAGRAALDGEHELQGYKGGVGAVNAE